MNSKISFKDIDCYLKNKTELLSALEIESLIFAFNTVKNYLKSIKKKKGQFLHIRNLANSYIKSRQEKITQNKL